MLLAVATMVDQAKFKSTHLRPTRYCPKLLAALAYIKLLLTISSMCHMSPCSSAERYSACITKKFAHDLREPTSEVVR